MTHAAVPDGQQILGPNVALRQYRCQSVMATSIRVPLSKGSARNKCPRGAARATVFGDGVRYDLIANRHVPLCEADTQSDQLFRESTGAESYCPGPRKERALFLFIEAIAGRPTG
jgi:hypothetical protein